MSLARRLYRGETTVDFYAQRKRWYAISIALVVFSLAGIAIRGFNLGIDFEGGAAFQFDSRGGSVAQAVEAVERVGVEDPRVQRVGDGQIRVQTEELPTERVDEVARSLAQEFGVPEESVNPSQVGASWGEQITRRAVYGLVAFLVLVVIYLSIRFEPKMALGAFAALIHDLVVTAGIYAWVGFEVTPATVIALLTILGFSLYDTVVVFDKVHENTRGLAGGSRSTYTEAANLALNQTLMRSVNTSIIALLPVGGLLFVGVGLLGVGTLKDLALAMFVGFAAGAYSSVFLATPILVQAKEREPQYRALAHRVNSRRAGAARADARGGSAGGGASGGSTRVGSARAGSGQAGSGRAGSGQAGSGQAGSGQAGGPSGGGGGRAGGARLIAGTTAAPAAPASGSGSGSMSLSQLDAERARAEADADGTAADDLVDDLHDGEDVEGGPAPTPVGSTARGSTAPAPRPGSSQRRGGQPQRKRSSGRPSGSKRRR